MSISALSPTRSVDPFAALWDEPENSVSPKSTRPLEDGGEDHSESPAKRARKGPRLFLSDEENDADDRQPEGSKDLGVPLPPDLEAMFNDDTIDDPPSLDFGTSLSMAELNRRAEAKLSRTQPATSQAASGSKDHVVHMGGTSDAEDAKGDKEDPKKATKRPIAKLNEERLIGPYGFPALVKATKNFKVKGKGHELSDLQKTLELYQLWAHRMYPKLQFRDTAERVQKITHSRRMMVSLSVWKDEAVNGPRKAPDDDGPIDLTNQDDDDEEAGESHSRQVDESGRFVPLPGSASIHSAITGGRASARNNADKPGGDSYDDDLGAVDLDEFMADAHEPQPISAPKASTMTMDELDDDEMWNIADDMGAQAPSRSLEASVGNPKSQSERRDGDAEMWAEMLNDDDLEAFMNEDMDTSAIPSAAGLIDGPEKGARLDDRVGELSSGSEMVVHPVGNKEDAPISTTEPQPSKSNPLSAAIGMEIDGAETDEMAAKENAVVEKSIQDEFDEGWDDMYDS